MLMIFTASIVRIRYDHVDDVSLASPTCTCTYIHKYSDYLHSARNGFLSQSENPDFNTQAGEQTFTWVSRFQHILCSVFIIYFIYTAFGIIYGMGMRNAICKTLMV